MSLGSTRSNQGLRTEQVKRMLVRHVWELKLEPGDRLPSYENLRAELGVGIATINRAVRALEEDGVLKTKRRSGTYLVDPEADGRCGWVIGLAALGAMPEAISPFFSCLLYYLQTSFRELGCQTVVFYRKPTIEDQVGLDFFPGLQRCVSQGELDAVVLTAPVDDQSWNDLEEANMHPCFVGPPTPSPRCVSIDSLAGARSMIRELVACGCRRPALVLPEGTLHGDWFPAFREMLAEVEGARPERLFFPGLSTVGGRRIAVEIIARQPGDRPDGIAFLDDVAALALTCHLAKERIEYFPRLACMVNRQVPLDFPFKDMIFFENDVEKLARTTAEIMMRHFHGGHTPGDKMWIAPTKVAFNDQPYPKPVQSCGGTETG